MVCTQIIASESLLVDYESKIVSAINILDDFRSQTFPFAMKISVLSAIRKEEKDKDDFEISLEIALDKNVLVTKKLPIHFPKGYVNTKNITKFGGLIIPSAGELIFRILQDGDVKNSLSLQVSSADNPPKAVFVGEAKPI